MAKKVIVAGHICLDITPVFPQKKENQLSRIFTPGKLIQMEQADVHTGGAVANTGLAMKILGADVTLMGKIGTDAFGALVKNILEDYHVTCSMIESPEETTSYSVVLAVPGVDRIFLHHPGANHTFCCSDIPLQALQETALFHFGYPPLMRSMYENGGAELSQMMRQAKLAGAATSLDMASVDEDSEAGAADWELILERVLPDVDFFMPSVEELCYMLDQDRFHEWKKRAAGRDITEVLDIETDVRPLADRCMDFGAKVLLIKCGAPGLYYRTADSQTLEEISDRVGLNCEQWADREGFEPSYVPERLLSGTGAGDTTIAAFLTAMLRGCSLERSLQIATAAGASCVAAYDALSGLQSFEELEQKIDGGWRKHTEQIDR